MPRADAADFTYLILRVVYFGEALRVVRRGDTCKSIVWFDHSCCSCCWYETFYEVAGGCLAQWMKVLTSFPTLLRREVAAVQLLYPFYLAVSICRSQGLKKLCVA